MKSILLAGLLVPAAWAQMNMSMSASEMYLMNMASGTSRNPESAPMSMLMGHAGSWDLMWMGQAFLVDTQSSGPRGGDKLYSPNSVMVSAMHKLGLGTVMFESMLSLEPATITNRSYPLLFQTGETAFGRGLVDAQHPHNFVMSLSMHYARTVGEGTTVQLYYAPVGDPALGPVAFPHRASAAEIPQAALSHHWQDSTHIADNVATAAIQHRWLRLEASGFYGTEPDENRWHINWGPMNSYAGRVSVTPSADWMMQVSAGRIAKPERQEAGDVVRTTASVHYSTPGGWSTSLIWGRNHDTFTHHNLNSYLLESVLPVAERNFLTGRVELVDKDELSVAGQYRVSAYTGGYTRDLGTFWHVETGLGANVTGYGVPAGLQTAYGKHPWGASVFLRLRLK